MGGYLCGEFHGSSSELSPPKGSLSEEDILKSSSRVFEILGIPTTVESVKYAENLQLQMDHEPLKKVFTSYSGIKQILTYKGKMNI
ncbi:unnamed protein product [Acanthoscelides obtectus]|uniref:Uncharacterized protein n=1 Tax=Acanthoscelides obtectus TaxID=200917 RepID=A0A9P0Q6K3_ACAOB|nr:unnamed protein product [Acanthoscelides obtectus]CAK1620888.1 hypothetical protein AOBTE_LOCUS637 [Acanthoscelides obtectus]